MLMELVSILKIAIELFCNFLKAFTGVMHVPDILD